MVDPLILFGALNFQLTDPKPEIIFSRTDVDTLNESWQSDREDRFVEGGVHPTRPGMIIENVRCTIERPGELYIHAITALGDARGTRPTKILGRSDKRTLDSGWDEQSVEYLSWHAAWKPCTATASTDVVDLVGHGFSDGQRVVFRGLTGGGGIVPASDTDLGTIYYVINAAAHSFQISATLGGSAFDITTNMTAGTVCAAEFVKGAQHPDYPYMYLVDVSRSDQGTAWRRVSCTYRGLMESKPYKRIITCNGQEVSSSELLTVAFTDGFTSKYGQVALPEVVVTDTYLTTADLDTDEIPYSQGEGATPPDAPDIRSIVISAPVDQLTYKWPNGWSRMAEQSLDSIPLTTLHLKQRVTRYIWPLVFR